MNATYHEKQITIAGETITAKYREYTAKPILTEQKSLKIFEDIWDNITYPFYWCRNKFREARHNIRYGFQRMFRGYDDIETYSLDTQFISRYTKIIKTFKDNLHGVPHNLTEEEWNNILDKMLFHLYYMDEENIYKELYKDIPDNWLVSFDTTAAIMDHHKNEFFKLFSEHFYDLWD